MAAAAPLPDDEIAEWFARQLPDGWFTGPPRVLVDRDEILLVGELSTPATGTAGDDEREGTGGTTEAHDVDEGERAAVEQARITRFREETRDHRVQIATRAEALYGRKVSWAARCGTTRATFTHLSVPVMTRLRMEERRILDTLVASGVARSRSDALAWCVRLVAEHEGDWIRDLRDALEAVEQVKARRRA